MNSLRSTERSLNLLRGPIKLRTHRFNAQPKNFDLYLRPRESYRLRNYGSSTIFSRINFRTPRIKVDQVTQVRLESIQAKDTSFLSPNKPNREDLKNVTVQPIIPLTQPRFTKSGNNVEVAPSVTKILSATMPAASQFLLDRWKESMIKKLGIEGFNQYQKDTFERGRVLHAVIAKYLLGQGEPTVELSKEVVSNLWKSIQDVIQKEISNVRLVEHVVTHPSMNYRGIVDCVGFYKDELVVIDFKTAEKPKKNVDSLYDNPLQVTAYCGAINNDTNIPVNVIDRNITSGLVIVAYSDGSKASVYYLDEKEVYNDYWKKWITRLDQYTRLEELRQRIPAQKNTQKKLD